MRSINYRLWGSIFLVAFFPAVYSTVRIYFLNSVPDTWNISIAAQSAWLHLSYEVLQEALLLPLYFVFGQVIRDLPALRDRVSWALVLTMAAYAVLTLIILVGADWFTAAMAQQVDLQSLTARFIRLESIAIMIGTLNDICIVVIVALGLYRLVLLLVVVRAIATIAFDAFFVGQFPWSMDLAVTGVALTNITVGMLLLIPSALILRRLGLVGRITRPANHGWARNWFRVAIRSGLESAVRNLAFSLMILRLMNEVQEAGLFWVTNGFIWGWLLLPVLTLGTLLRQDAGNHGGRLGVRFNGYPWLTLIIILVWLVTIPAWTWFVATAMGSTEADRVVSLTLLMLGFYIVFAFNHMLDSYFYGVGRTDLMLYQSLFVSIVYYGSAFVAYRMGVFVPDLQLIALLFGGGIVIDSLVTLWQFNRSGYFQLAHQHPEATKG
ncbi:MATE family Na+-driven efflux transporter [Yoonia vestfoldensis]|uniref:MATE family Na+-driven efflux transporter n=1 Tax=Yoonia vestfoldensis TaxID=245188 RepID=UPI000367DF54|nr:MATE family Na+-driven efflux transporter [Yoonia vestfoldensis]